MDEEASCNVNQPEKNQQYLTERKLRTPGAELESALLSPGQSTGSVWDVLHWATGPFPHAHPKRLVP